MAVSVGKHPHLNPRDLENIDFRNEDVNYAGRIDDRCSGRLIFSLWSLYHKFSQRCFVFVNIWNWDNSFPRSWSPRWVLRMGALLSNASFVTAIVPPKVASAHQGTARNASPVATSASVLLATKGAPRQTMSASWRALGKESVSRWISYVDFKSTLT